jgi:agmatine deiminase
MLPTVEPSTPLALGFKMPAEWERHHATWLAWPHEASDWVGKFQPIPWLYADIIRHLARVEEVYLLVEDASAEKRIKAMLKKSEADLDAIRFFTVPTDRSWLRDSGPTCLKTFGGEIAYVNWKFNAWAKYDNYKKDALVVSKVNAKLKQRVFQPTHKGQRVVLEGGAIEVNGLGTLIATEECLQSKVQERNPGFSKKDYEEIFRNYLGATNVLWLKAGIAGDDTHGHVDDLTRFVNATTVVTVIEDNPNDVNFAPLKENFELLKSMKDQDGRPLRVETLPMPEPLYFNQERLPASYANFYIANEIVVVPTFNDPKDRLALNKLAELFPDREVIGIYGRDLIVGQGTLHCMTQQEPAAK